MAEEIRQGDIPGVQLRCRQALAVSLPEAWSWLTEPARLARWLGDRAEVALRPAGFLEVHGTAEDGSPLHERGTTLAIEPPARWVLSFRRLDAGWPAATRLTLEITAREDGCEVAALHEGFQHLPLSECLTIWEAYRRRWRAALARLAAAADAGSPPP